MIAPGKLTRPFQTTLDKLSSQLWRARYVDDTLGELLRGKARKIYGRVSTNFAVYRQVGSYNGLPAGHGFYQRMREGFTVSRSYVNVAGADYVLQVTIWNCAEFDDLI